MTIKKTWLLLVVPFAIVHCSNDKAPDVSGISVDIKIKRFDKYLFEKTDTSDLAHGLNQMSTIFPFFTKDFMTNILGLGYSGNFSDSSMAGSISELKHFIRITKPLYDSIALKFTNSDRLEHELDQAFRYVKYYFPGYRVPEIVSYVGPFNSPGIAITPNALAIGLQLYAGRDFSFYTSSEGLEVFPVYISRRFEPQYIPVNSMKAVVEDLYPDKSRVRPLIEQMIETGKQWYLLDKFLPESPDSLKTGYTQQQLKWCSENEGQIWNFFLQSNDLYSSEPALVQNYIGEAPTTQGMPDTSPGNIGQWTGWQIVKKYVSGNKKIKPDELMKMDAKKIFAESKYKPR